MSITPLGARGADPADAAIQVVNYVESKVHAARRLAPDPTGGVRAYYADSVEGPGRWAGGGSTALGVHGEVAAEHLERVLVGTHPGTGEVLRPAGRTTRHVTSPVSSDPATSTEVLSLAEAARVSGVSARTLRAIAERTKRERATRGDAALDQSRASTPKSVLVAARTPTRQDLLRGVRWRPAGKPVKPQPVGRAVTDAEIPTTIAVHALAAACAEHTAVWWREFEILFVAYSGMRWGEHVALTADRVDTTRRRLTIDRQIVETRDALRIELPKGRRRRVTMYPAVTPGGVDLTTMIDRRLAELEENGIVFPAPRGGWARRSNYGRNTWDPAATTIDWPRPDDGRWHWTFHSLRHVFATWALNQPGLRIEDVSRLLGHSSTRVTQDIYIHVHDDLYQRFYSATG